MALSAIETFKQKLAAADPIPRSEDTSSFPLWALLILLEKAGDAAFNDYCKGAAIVYSWLSQDQEAILYPSVAPELSIPRTACGYLSLEVAKILTGDRSKYNNIESYLASLKHKQQAIYFCNLTTRIPTNVH